MKITTQRVVIIQDDEGLRSVRHSDPTKAAEHWARIKEDEWLEKHKDLKKYQDTRYSRARISNELYGDGRIRYRKYKRRALAVFRRIMEEQK